MDLSRRERQIMEIVYRLGQASAAEVREEMPDPPSYSAVRAQLRVLEDKGRLSHAQEGPRYVYRAVVPREEAREPVLERVVTSFFDGSVTKTVAALLDMEGSDLTEDELDALGAMIERAKRQGR
jgi:predicted transcriptional regulator